MLSYSPSAIAIRTATPQDEEGLEQLSKSAFALHRRIYQPTPDAVRRQADESSAFNRLVASLEGQLVGTVKYRAVEDRLHLVGLAVHPAWQGRGIARRLVVEVARHAAAHGAKRLSLYTVAEAGNVPVFERLGFRRITEGSAPDLIGVDGLSVTEVYMERWVDWQAMEPAIDLEKP